MGLCTKCMLLGGVSIIVLAIYLNEPMHPSIANPLKYKAISAFLKIGFDIAYVWSLVTGEDVRLVEQRLSQNSVESTAGSKIGPDIKFTVTSFDGVPVYIYEEKTRAKSPSAALMYMHGGAFRLGHPVANEQFYRRYIEETGSVIFSVKYRLAPQHPVPAAFEDCEKVANYLFLNADKYGIDPNKIGIAGDSAGGQLAAATVLRMRDKSQFQFTYQILIYPPVQGIDRMTPSHEQNKDFTFRMLRPEGIGQNKGAFFGVSLEYSKDFQTNTFIRPEVRDRYLKYLDLSVLPEGSIPKDYKRLQPKEYNKELAEKIEKFITDPHIYPLMADDLSNLPPTFVLTIESDVIRDDGMWYYHRLQQAGNNIFHHHSPDGWHGMITFLDPPMAFDSAILAFEALVKFVKERDLI